MSEPDDLFAMANAVVDETTLIDFIEALALDWFDERRKDEVDPPSPYGPGSNGWEHGTVGEYLEAAAAWATASTGSSPGEFYVVSENPWTRMAQILYAAKIYE